MHYYGALTYFSLVDGIGLVLGIIMQYNGLHELHNVFFVSLFLHGNYHSTMDNYSSSYIVL